MLAHYYYSTCMHAQLSETTYKFNDQWHDEWEGMGEGCATSHVKAWKKNCVYACHEKLGGPGTLSYATELGGPGTPVPMPLNDNAYGEPVWFDVSDSVV